MNFSNVQFVLTDIEGTTTSVSFVYEVLFPYFQTNIYQLKDLTSLDEVKDAFQQTIEIAKTEGIILSNDDEIIAQLLKWCLEDKKITPLKTLQGILWNEGYQSGEIKGHVYDEVADQLLIWKQNNIQMGVFSSGSIAAQKLIFGYSVAGDLTPYFSAYFDTTTGGKREKETYSKIASKLDLEPNQILFLSDIIEELEAANEIGYQTVQLVRPRTEAKWKKTVADFSEIVIIN
ncbi:MAG: acireductone synthase [Flavobacteriia bacterium]|nr:acireductone synthase [Flavobacteriia bacterium]